MAGRVSRAPGEDEIPLFQALEAIKGEGYGLTEPSLRGSDAS